MTTILAAGEMLWDVLPGGEFPGGAPFNVAAHAARLGATALLATRLGQDERGRRALDLARRSGIDTRLVQFDHALPTGVARAVLDAHGAASYEFLSPCAWDALEATPQLLEAAAGADALFHGTLAQRDARSRATIAELARRARWRVFDPNLRAPHIDRAVCEAGLWGAGLVKLNEEECAIFGGWFGVAPTPEALWEAMRARHGVQALCVTLGARGAVLQWRGQWHRQEGVPTQVADTVGAGDAFLALLACELLVDTEAPLALGRAARLAAFVASRPGAVPDYDARLYRS